MTTHRERVLMAVNHQQPDLIPIDLGGIRSSGIMAIAYKKLKDHLKINSGNIYVYDFIQQIAVSEKPVLDRFGIDTIEMGRGFLTKDSDWKDWVLPDGTPCKIPNFINVVKVGKDWHALHTDGTLIAIQKEGCLYFEQTIRPSAGKDDNNFLDLEKDLDKVMWVHLPTPPAVDFNSEESLKELELGAKKLRESTDRAIIGQFGGNFNELGQMLYGVGEFLMMMAGEPKRVHGLFDALLEIHLRNLEKYLKAVGPYIDICLFADDIGMQSGPQFSTKMYYEFFHPRYKTLWGKAKELANVKTLMHCCGGVYPLIPGLIEAGLDILQPVQITCKDMEPQKLKRDYGKDICFWGGGCDTREILPHGKPDEVRRHVKEMMEIWAPGGGYVFQAVHNIMADVPPENVEAMFDAINS